MTNNSQQTHKDMQKLNNDVSPVLDKTKVQYTTGILTTLKATQPFFRATQPFFQAIPPPTVFNDPIPV